MTDAKPILTKSEINAGALALARVLRVDQSLPHGWSFDAALNEDDVRHCHFVRGDAVVAVQFELTNDLQTTVRNYRTNLDAADIYSFAEMWVEMGYVDQRVWVLDGLAVRLHGIADEEDDRPSPTFVIHAPTADIDCDDFNDAIEALANLNLPAEPSWHCARAHRAENIPVKYLQRMTEDQRDYVEDMDDDFHVFMQDDASPVCIIANGDETGLVEDIATIEGVTVTVTVTVTVEAGQ